MPTESPDPPAAATTVPADAGPPGLLALAAAHPLAAALVAIVLPLAVAVAYLGVLDNGFTNWDDDLYSTRTPWLMSLDGGNLRKILTDRELLYWHPISYLWHATENHFWKAAPENHRWYHLTSVVLHLGNAALSWLLLAGLLRRALPRDGRDAPAERAVLLAAGAGALLWAVHPLRVESVAWMSEKKDLLSAMFGLAAALAWLRFGDAPEGARRGPWAWAMAFGALAIASKLQAVVVPATLLVLDVWPLRRLRLLEPRTWARCVVEKGPLLLVAAAAAAYTLTTDREIDRLGVRAEIPLAVRCARAVWGLAWYPWKTLWPSDLCPVRPNLPAAEETFADPAILACTAALAAATWFCVDRWRRGSPWWAAAGLWYLVTIAPVCGFKQLGVHSTADRFAYTSTLGMFALVAGGAFLALRSGRRAAAALVLVPAAAVAIVLGECTAAQVEVWRDSETMWTRVVTRFPGRLAVAYSNLGAHYHGKYSETRDPRFASLAEKNYRESLAVEPWHASAWNNIGILLGQASRHRESEAAFRNAVAASPRFSLGWANLAVSLLQQGRRQEARRAWSLADGTGGRVSPVIRSTLEGAIGPPDPMEEGDAEREVDSWPAPTGGGPR
jgi:hypothetical protein